jgi:hypothetical protein
MFLCFEFWKLNKKPTLSLEEARAFNSLPIGARRYRLVMSTTCRATSNTLTVSGPNAFRRNVISKLGSHAESLPLAAAQVVKTVR